MYDKLHKILFTDAYPYKTHVKGDIWNVQIDNKDVLVREIVDRKTETFEAELLLPREVNTLKRIKLNSNFVNKLEQKKTTGEIPTIKQKNKEQLSVFNIRTL